MIRHLAAVIGMALAMSVSTADARPIHHHHYHAAHHVQHVRNVRHYAHHRHGRLHLRSFASARAQLVRDSRPSWPEPFKFQSVKTARAVTAPIGVAGGYVSQALAHVGEGARQVGVRSTLWCAAFVNKVLARSGYHGTGSDLAASFSRWGRPAGSQPGAIAVMHRGRSGGHVGIVLADHGSTVTVVSGNHGHRVAVSEYPKSRIYAYRMP